MATSKESQVYALYKPFRNQVSKLEREDSLRVIWAYIQKLQFNSFKFPGDIEVHSKFLYSSVPQTLMSEWQLEILTKEVILHSGTKGKLGKSLRYWDSLAKLINSLKNIENEIYGIYGSKEKILLEICRISHQQFPWQGAAPSSVSAIRYFLIFNHPEIDKISQSILGLSIREIYIICLSVLGHFLGSHRIDFPLSTDIPGISLEKIDRFLKFTACHSIDLQNILKSEQHFDESYPYAYSSLRKFPLVIYSNEFRKSLFCPLPTLLYWRITSGLYYEFLDEPQFAQPFGDSFQHYVGNVIKKACTSKDYCLLEERAYGPKKLRKQSIDWILKDDEKAALFIECKSKRISWISKTTLNDSTHLERDLEYLAEAIIQTYKTVCDYRNGLYEHIEFTPERRVFPIIITLENWYFLGPLMNDMLEKLVLAKLDKNGMERSLVDEMPYQVWAVEESEVAFQIVDRIGILEFMLPKLSSPDMNLWNLHGYINKIKPEGFQARKLFESEYDHEIGIVDNKFS